jgi:archaellum component FlaC
MKPKRSEHGIQPMTEAFCDAMFGVLKERDLYVEELRAEIARLKTHAEDLHDPKGVTARDAEYAMEAECVASGARQNEENFDGDPQVLRLESDNKRLQSDVEMMTEQAITFREMAESTHRRVNTRSRISRG